MCITLNSLHQKKGTSETTIVKRRLILLNMQIKENIIFLLLGGNLGDVPLQFKEARTHLSKKVGSTITNSKLYQSEPWGFDSANLFLNQVLQIRTHLSPNELLLINQDIEIELGRKRDPKTIGFESRVIDIDILYFGSQVLKSNRLTIPHYALHLRRFTLLPLVEIAPNYIHPTIKKSNLQLLNDCVDKSIVTSI